MQSNSRLATATTVVLTACALLVTFAVVRREFFRGSGAPKDRRVSNVKVAFTAGHRMGPESAPVSMLVFSDFQCPFCVVLEKNLAIIRKRYPESVSVTFRHLPGESIHPYAFDAALASECAAKQGRFEAYHDALFAGQDSIPNEQWSQYALQAQLPSVAAFEECMKAREFDERIKADISQAKKFKLTGTPSVIIGETLLGGTPSARTLDSIVRVAVGQSVKP